MAKTFCVIQIKLNPLVKQKCLYDHWLSNKACLSAITVTNISQIFTYKMAAKISWHRYGTKLRHCHSMYGRDADAREQWTRRVSGSTCSGQFRSVHFSLCAVNKPLDEFERGMSDAWNNKKLSYRRGTARFVVSVEILPISTQLWASTFLELSW